jgi:hypothetical protein
MERQATGFLRYALTIALALGMLLSSYARMASHEVANPVQISTEHHAEIEDHGNTHREVSDSMQAYQGHSHNVADHDHNIAFLPLRSKLGVQVPTLTSWSLANDAFLDHRSAELDRPPKV